MFRGRYEHSIDDKSRLAIPAKFREIILDQSKEGELVATNFDRCLSVYALEDWQRLEKKLASLPQFDANVMAFQRFFISGAAECTLDKAGRILLPQNLRQFAKINHDCVIIGQLAKFEIWSAESWATSFATMSSQFVQITESMSKLGINL